MEIYFASYILKVRNQKHRGLTYFVRLNRLADSDRCEMTHSKLKNKKLQVSR